MTSEELFNMTRPKLNPKKGSVIITSSGGDFDNKFKNLYFNSNMNQVKTSNKAFLPDSLVAEIQKEFSSYGDILRKVKTKDLTIVRDLEELSNFDLSPIDTLKFIEDQGIEKFKNFCRSRIKRQRIFKNTKNFLWNTHLTPQPYKKPKK